MNRPANERHGERLERELQALKQARRFAGALAAGVLVLAGASGFVGARPVFPSLGAAAALAGLISPVIGYRLYAWLRERYPAEASHVERCAGFVRATLLSLAVSESVALFGIFAYWFSAALPALIGVVTHVILVGAVWPTDERLEAFLDGAAASPGGASS